MAQKNVVVAGYTKSARYMISPLIEKIYKSYTIVWLYTINEINSCEGTIDSICINLFSLGYDAKNMIGKIRKQHKHTQIVCIGNFYISPYIGKHLVDSGTDIIYANIENDMEYSNMIFSLQNNLKYYPKNVRDFINSEHDFMIPHLFKLSPKEKLNLEMSCDRKSSKEIARFMNIKLCTVSTMRRNTLRKTGFENWEKALSYGIICKFSKLEA